jgi:hypothetical protein
MKEGRKERRKRRKEGGNEKGWKRNTVLYQSVILVLKSSRR